MIGICSDWVKLRFLSLTTFGQCNMLISLDQLNSTNIVARLCCCVSVCLAVRQLDAIPRNFVARLSVMASA